MGSCIIRPRLAIHTDSIFQDNSRPSVAGYIAIKSEMEVAAVKSSPKCIPASLQREQQRLGPLLANSWSKVRLMQSGTLLELRLHQLNLQARLLISQSKCTEPDSCSAESVNFITNWKIADDCIIGCLNYCRSLDYNTTRTFYSPAVLVVDKEMSSGSGFLWKLSYARRNLKLKSKFC